jgi:hypothetical protein
MEKSTTAIKLETVTKLCQVDPDQALDTSKVSALGSAHGTLSRQGMEEMLGSCVLRFQPDGSVTIVFGGVNDMNKPSPVVEEMPNGEVSSLARIMEPTFASSPLTTNSLAKVLMPTLAPGTKMINVKSCNP